jgi:outer membrane protein OmpA-like peptidoglycan-associated protein
MAVQDFANGANILQQVDVSQIFKSLAMGIAEAQQELDDNSIAQLERLSETELAGKSLLELGFVPAFYSFTYADISASIHLRMAEKTSLELGIAASFDYASSTDAESDFNNLSKEHQFFSEKEEFKSNRKFSMKSSSTSRVKVNNQYYALNQNEGSVSMIEKMHDELLEQEAIERVNIQRSEAYTTVYKAEQNFTGLKITSFSPVTADFGAVSVTITTDFAATFPSSPAPGMFGFSGSKVWGLAPGPIDLEFYFDFDKRVMDFDYDQTVSTYDKRAVFNALGAILRTDPSLIIKIEGYTDGSGPDNYNDHLSDDRCNALLNWLLAKGADLTQLQTHGNGESLAGTNQNPAAQFRKVTVILPPGRSYIYYPVYNATPTFSVSTVNTFLLPAATSFIVTNESAEQFESGESLYTSLAEYESGNSSHFYSETREGILHLLHKDTELTFMAYSEDSENIEIVAEEGSEENIRVYNNENETERIKNLATKNRTNRTFAAGASVDFRFSRQFEMSVEGSASMSAHMVAVPPPEAFTLHIATAFNPPTP